MKLICPRLTRGALALFTIAVVQVLTCCTKKSPAQTLPADLTVDLKTPFRFVVYGDARFHDPRDTDAANPPVRRALVQAIAQGNPAFICFTGDIVYNGYDDEDWKVWDSETREWRDKKIPIYPALGNHDLHGDPKVALGHYFERFPELKSNRYYSAQAANVLLLVLDSSLEEVAGPQGEWLAHELDHVPSDVDFVLIVDHHPPYSSSSDARVFGGGHSARTSEQALAKVLEARQAQARYRIVFFSGHVHNYERHEHGGITYFVSGGGGAHAYPIQRASDDPFQSKEINYHYLLVEVDHQQMKVSMNRLQLEGERATWTIPDQVRISVPNSGAMKAAR